MKNLSRSLCALLSALLLASSLSACQGGEVQTDNPPAQTTAAASGAGDSASDSIPDTTAAAPYTGYVFTVDGTALHPGGDPTLLLPALGEPLDKLEAASCVHDGFDRVYTYAGFEVNTQPTASGRETIVSIYLTDDSVQTDEGIRIGSTLEEVKTAYGDSFTVDGDQYVFARDSAALCFRVDAAGFVTSVCYQ